ncbi:MAG: hypothetical protein DYG89_10095 [Caldilinea sp. CFX5]|nr:hypothetical protein [Caldilinea sp. CFX5]
MNFKLISEISDIQIIAKGKNVDIHHQLNRAYGYGDWRKLKGVGMVEYENGQIWMVELHWFEAHGIGRKRMKDKFKLKRIA